MRLCSFRGVEIRCSPLLLLALPAAYVLGRGRLAVTTFASLSVHEAAHAVAARRAGCRVEAVELQPFGFVARLENLHASPHDAAAVFAAGPVASICLAAAAALLLRLLKAEAAPLLINTLESFCDQNLLIAAVNLLPALPLDGGRLIHALLLGAQGTNPHSLIKKPVRVLAVLGAFTGAFMLAAFAWLLMLGSFNPSLLLMGGFLIPAAVNELKASGLERLRGRRLAADSAITVKQLALGTKVSIASAISMLPIGAYALISVVDSSGCRIATMDEGQLMLAAQRLGGSAPLGSAVAYLHSKVL